MSENAENTLVKRYYPTLSSVVTEDDFPDVLGFIKDGILNLFEKIHYKDLQYNKSPRGDAAFYGLSIVAPDRIAIEIPGTGIYLVLNPDLTGGDYNISSFPITVEYEWQVLAYLREFSLGNFSFQPQEIFEIALRILNINEEQAMAQFINTFTVPVDDDTSALEQYKQDIENEIGQSLEIDINEDTQLYQLVEKINEKTDQYATLIGFGTYILQNDIDETWTKLKRFFRNLLPEDIDAYVKEILVPKFRATLLLTAAIEFPRSILKPVFPEETAGESDGHPDLEVIPEGTLGFPDKVLLSFGEALFYADTEKGFGYNLDIILNTVTPAQIGNTGLIIDIHNLKVDLSRTENIVEADLDNRPPEFMGVYMERTDIYLPKKWFKKDTGQTLAITGDRLLIGTGGMSGTIALRATYAQDEVGNVTDYFSEFFDFNYPISVVSNGTGEPINDYTSLLTHINSLENPYQLKFQFPLSITANNVVHSFEKEIEYYDFINAIDVNRFMWFKLGKNPNKVWEIGFEQFDLTFYHGEVVESNLHAQLVIPKLKRNDGVTNSDGKTVIDLQGHWNNEDNFNLTSTFLPTGLPLNIFNFVTLNFLSAELGKEDDNFYIGTQCEIWFENAIMQKILGEQKIVIPKLRVYDNGSIEIVGGNAFIPTNINLNLGPVEVAVTGIHFGSHQQEHNGVMRKYNYWGFDGAISLDPLGIDARGEGIKYYYTTDNDEKLQEALDSGAITQQQIDSGDVSADDYGDSFLRIQTIELDMIIPGTASPKSALAIIHGMLSIPEPGESPEYIGEVSVKLPKARIGGGAAMRLQPKHPAFLLEVGIDMAIPLPLAATGLGFYGFGGLLGFRYVAEKGAIVGMTSDNTWYEYFTYPQRGVNIHKFSGPPRSLDFGNPFSIGAGTVIGTMGDDGNLFSTRLMAILSLPSVFILDGRANILSERLGMMDHTEPPFFAGVAIGDHSFEFWFGADYNLPESNGNIIDLYAEVQAYFSTNNSKAWYIHFGTKQNPIQAELLFHIFRMQSYLMISAQGIESGARADFYLEKKFFGIRVKISAYLELGGFISFERPQIGGYIAAGGMIGINVWRILFVDIGLDVIFSVEAVKPFLVYAELKVRIKIRILRFIKIKFKVTLKLKWEFNRQVDRTPVMPLEHDRVEQAVKGIHMLTQEAFDLDYFSSEPSESQITQTIPLDTYVDIKMAKGLVPGAISDKIGGYTHSPENHIDLIPPKKNVRGGWELRQVKHKYSIEAINIKAWNGSWQDYHPFEAVVHADNRSEVISNLKIGYWQKLDKQYDTIRLLATNPFTFTESGEPGWVIPEQFGITASDLFCQSEVKRHDCSNVLEKPLGTVYYPPTQYMAHFIDGAYYTLDGAFYQAVDANTGAVTIEEDHFRVTNAPNNFDFPKSLEFDNYNALVIILPAPSIETKLKLTSNAQRVKITYYKSVRDDYTPTTNYVAFDEQILSSSQLSSVITSPSSNELISKIIISPQSENTIEIFSVQEQMAQIQQQADIGNNGVLEGDLLAQYEDLENLLKKLKSEGCQNSVTPCQKDERLCEFHDYLETTLNNCISYDAEDLFWGNWSCFEDFIKLIYGFDEANSEYHLVENLQVVLQDLIDYPKVTKPPVLKGALQLAQTILNVISKLGNCDCQLEEVICTTSLQEICWMTLENWEYNQTIPEIEAIVAEQQAMVNGVQQTVQPIWRPHTKYYIHFQLKDEVDNGVNQGIYDYYYGFKTAGPVGHFHKQIPYVPNGESTDQYPITSLRSYIDYNRSYPNADGNLLQAKPLFFGQEQCKLDIYFIKPFVYHMLNKWNEYNGLPELLGEMHLAIKDPITDVIIPYPLPVDFEEETVPGTITSWESDEDPRIPIQIQMLNNFIEHVNHVSDTISCELTLGEAIKPLSYSYSVELTHLKPRKLYTALVYNAFDVNGNGNLEEVESEKVHEYVFQTSRYKNFRAQVESYWLKELDTEGNIIEQRQAVFDYPLNITPVQIDSLYSLIGEIPDENAQTLEKLFYHPFDRALEGILGIIPPNPPENTEFNKIINENTGEVVALWIRNPEPFNNPKIPLEEIIDTVEVMNAASDYKYLHSKDYSQILIMNDTKKITENGLNLKFKYKSLWEWNEEQQQYYYLVVDESTIPTEDRIHTVEVNQIIINQ